MDQVVTVDVTYEATLILWGLAMIALGAGITVIGSLVVVVRLAVS